MDATIIFIIISFAILLFAIYYVFFQKRKDGYADIFEERGSEGEEHLVVIKSNVKYSYIDRKKGKPDSQHIKGYKDFAPIPKTFAIPWLSKKTDKMYIFRDKDGLMHPMYAYWDAKEKAMKLRPDYRDTIDWLVSEFDEKDKIREQVKGIEKYMPQITLGIVFLFAFMSLYFNWQHEEKMSNQIQGDAAAFDKQYHEALNQFDPTILVKAQAIISQYQMDHGTINWTTTNIIKQNNGIQVSS